MPGTELTAHIPRVPQNKLEEELASLKRVYYLDSGYPDLLTFTSDTVNYFLLNGKGKAVTMGIGGTIGAGKSFWRVKVKEYVELQLRQNGITQPVVVVNWDKTEDDLINSVESAQMCADPKDFPPSFNRLVDSIVDVCFQTKPDEPKYGIHSAVVRSLLLSQKIEHGKPYQQEFLYATAIALQQNLAERLAKKEPNTFIIVDKLDNTSPVDDTQNPFSHMFQLNTPFYRNYGARTLQDLYHRYGYFGKIRSEDTYMAGLGIVPGPRMGPLILARELIQNTLKLKNHEAALDLANETASTFGIPQFESYEHLLTFPTGGSADQVYYARKGTMLLANSRLKFCMFLEKIARNRGRISKDRQKELLSFKVPQEIRDIANSLMRNAGMNGQDAKVRWEELFATQAKDPRLAEIIADRKEISEILLDPSPIGPLFHDMLMLISARTLEEVCRDYAGENILIAYNNPKTNIQIEEVRRLMQEMRKASEKKKTPLSI